MFLYTSAVWDGEGGSTGAEREHTLPAVATTKRFGSQPPLRGTRQHCHQALPAPGTSPYTWEKVMPEGSVGWDGARLHREVLSTGSGYITPLWVPALKILVWCGKYHHGAVATALLYERTKMSGNTVLTSLWQTVHRVWRFSREHCPPPL